MLNLFSRSEKIVVEEFTVVEKEACIFDSGRKHARNECTLYFLGTIFSKLPSLEFMGLPIRKESMVQMYFHSYLKASTAAFMLTCLEYHV